MKRFFLLALITSVVLPTYSDSRFKQRFLGCYESFCQVEIKKNNPDSTWKRVEIYDCVNLRSRFATEVNEKEIPEWEDLII